MAEGLNNNYFYNGRHTPLMIMIRNGTLTDDSYSHLKEYMNDIKGEKRSAWIPAVRNRKRGWTF